MHPGVTDPSGQGPLIALIGPPNSGKTTLFNRLTHATAVASDALFVTLDPLVRQARLPDNRVLLISDTVGFIDRLPHGLVAAFRATLPRPCPACYSRSSLVIPYKSILCGQFDRRAKFDLLGE